MEGKTLATPRQRIDDHLGGAAPQRLGVEGSQALITADISGNTAPPWAMAAVDPTGAVRVDSLTAGQLQTLSQQLQTSLQSAFTALMVRLLTPATTAP